MTRTTPRTRRALLAGAAVATGLSLALVPTAASAHVRVVPESTTADGWTVLTFRVPNESPTASTSAVTVDLPLDTPLLHVSTKPVPGWTAQVTTATLPQAVDTDGTTITQAPAHVTWTASAGAEVGPGEFQEFEISVGPLPAAGTDLVLPAHQTYTDGTVVDWDETATGGEEPEHPAPALTTTDAADASDTVAVSDGTATPAATAADPVDELARLLAAAAAGLGVVALVVALVAARRRGGAA